MEPLAVYRVVKIYEDGISESSLYEGVSTMDVLAQISGERLFNKTQIINISIIQVKY